MKTKKPIKLNHDFDQDEIAERIDEALARALAVPDFREFRFGMLNLTLKQDAFVRLWIEQALRCAHSPSRRQAERSEAEERRIALLHLSLTSAQQRELVRVSDEPFPDDRLSWRTRKRIPMATYRVLHAAGLVSTKQTATELGIRVALEIKRAQTPRSQQSL